MSSCVGNSMKNGRRRQLTPMRTEWLRRSIEACNGGVRSHRPTGDLSFYLNALFLRVRHSPSVGSADSSLPEGAKGTRGFGRLGTVFCPLRTENRPLSPGCRVKHHARLKGTAVGRMWASAPTGAFVGGALQNNRQGTVLCLPSDTKPSPVCGPNVSRLGGSYGFLGLP